MGPRRMVTPVAPWSPKMPMTIDLGPHLAPGDPGCGLGLDLTGCPWHFERARLAAGGIVYIPRKLVTAITTGRQEVLTSVPFGGPRDVPLDLAGVGIGTCCTPLARP